MKKSFFIFAGVATLLLGVGLNLQNALDDYGLTKNTLNVFMLVQATGSDSNATPWTTTTKGKTSSMEVECERTITITTTKKTTTSNSTTVGGSGEVSAGGKILSGKTSGKAESTNGQTSGDDIVTTVVSKEKFKATKFTCAPGDTATCKTYNPCLDTQ
jgi:hypothetical protein